MRFAFTSAFIFAVTSSAATASSDADDARRNYLPMTHVRSLAMKSIHEAQSRALLVERKAQNMDDIDIAAIMCQFLPMVTEDPAFADAMEQTGMNCEEYGCSEDNKFLIMKCSMPDETCETANDGVEYCVKDTTIDFQMELDFEGESDIITNQCSVYTKPANLANLNKGCFNMKATIDFGSIIETAMDDAMSGGATMSEEEATKMAMEAFDISECSANFEDGTTCDCSICDEGLGFELNCKKNGMTSFLSEQCTDFDTSAVSSVGSMGGGGGGSSAPGVSIVPLSAATADFPDVDPGDILPTDPGAAAAMGNSPASNIDSKSPLAVGLVLAMAYTFSGAGI